jgi:hypothetical protein
MANGQFEKGNQASLQHGQRSIFERSGGTDTTALSEPQWGRLAELRAELATSGGVIDALRERAARMREQDDYEARVFAALGLTTDETLARIEAAMIEDGEPPSAWPALAKMLRGGSTNDGKLADSLDSAAALAPHPDCI